MSSLSIPRAREDQNIWLQVGTLIDGTSDVPLSSANVVYNRAGILFVGAAAQKPPGELLRSGQTTPDVTALEHTLFPGLIEAHAHFFLEGGELDPDRRSAYLRQTPAELLSAAQQRLEPLVRLGIAGVRDAGDKDGVGLALSRQGAARDVSNVLMPYVESPGAAIHHRGRYGSFMADALENYASPRACVEARVAAGADRIKLIPTGIINFKQAAVTSEPQMTTEEVTQLVAAAQSFHRQTFAHASGDVGIDRAIDGGVDSIEHGFFIRDDQLGKLRDRQIAWVPTFAPVLKQIEHADRMGWDAQVVGNLRKIIEQHAASLAKAHAMGVQIIAGSDAGSYGVAHGVGLLEEMEAMERAGLPAMAVIRAATGVSTGRLRYRDKIGRIHPGCRSRFILTRHSPLLRISHLRKPRTVVFDGESFETGETTTVSGL
jgi:imidazolonepropionase-like amidohydrolase